MPCYEAGTHGDYLRLARLWAQFVRRGAEPRRCYRCPDCGKQKRIRESASPPDECPDCGRDVGDRWHEVQEG